MFEIIRRRLDAGALLFCANDPSDHSGYARVVGRLRDRVARSTLLLQQEHHGHQEVDSAVERQQTLRDDIRVQLLALRAVAGAGRQDEPALGELLLLPPLRGPHLEFLAESRRVLAVATPHAVLLSYHGLPDDLLDRLARDVEEFDRILSAKGLARGSHVGASADLHATASEILAIMAQLDALNRLRFRRNAELLAAWNSARDVAWPRRHRKQPAPSDTESSPDDLRQQ